MTIEELEKNIQSAYKWLDPSAEVTVSFPGQLSECEVAEIHVQLDNDGVPRLVIRPAIIA
jgi:hypothetical protein